MPDERERNFDKALGRHLRSSAASGEAVPSSAGSASNRASCPDSETLAAYHERSLLPEQMNSWKEHIVGCAPCQSILAYLEATDEIPLQASAEEGVFAAKETVPALTSRSLESFPAQAASNQGQRVDAAKPPKKSRRVLLLPGARWRWLAPAGALAASLLVWIALHENQRSQLQKMNEVQMASRQEPAPPSPSASSAAPQEEKSSHAALARPQFAGDQVGAARSRASSEPGNPAQRLPSALPAAPPKSLADKESDVRKQAGRDSAADSLIAENRADLDAKTLDAGALKKDEAQNQAANVQSQNQYNSNAPKVGGPAPLTQMQTNKMKSAPPAPAAPPPSPHAIGDATSAYGGAATLEVSSTISNPRLVSPPGSSVIWRAGRAGLIDFSKDNGSTWTRQSSGVLTDLLSGSAPSEQVCWIVGRFGAILLTTDGGAHWTLLSSPISEELGGVRATDALHSTIWNTPRTKSFETTDGGLTWKRVPNP